MKRHVWAIAAVAVLASTPLFALDTITRRSEGGKKATGTITGMSKTEINVKKSVGEPETIQANDVAAIVWDGGGPDLPLGYSDENGGKYESALSHYAKAKSDANAKNPSDHLKAEFEYVIARATAMASLSETDPAKQDAAIQKLLAIQKSRPEHFRYYESIHVLGQVLLAKGDYAGARTTFELLAKAPWNDYKMLAKIASGRVAVQENKLDEAAKLFEEAAASATDAPADQARKYQAMLGQARSLIAQTKFEEALQILELVTDKGPADESSVQAEAFVLEGNTLQALGRMKEACLAYLFVDLVFFRETALHAEALYNLAKTWKLVQHPERSDSAGGKLEKLYPNSVWRKKLAEGK